jgi:hypothetical protein
MTVGIYPALMANDVAERNHPTASRGNSPRIVLPDYLVEHDLPSAYQQAIGMSNASSTVAFGLANPAVSKSRVVELPVKDLRRLNVNDTNGKVRLLVSVDSIDGIFATRIPSPGLKNAGYKTGAWIVVRQFSAEDMGSDAWVIILRSRGKFSVTQMDWTIAHVKDLPGDDNSPPRLQISYGSATGKEFRSERIDRGVLTPAATIVCHADEDSIL